MTEVELKVTPYLLAHNMSCETVNQGIRKVMVVEKRISIYFYHNIASVFDLKNNVSLGTELFYDEVIAILKKLKAGEL